MKLLTATLSAGWLLVLLPPPEAAAQSPRPDLAARALAILKANCARCHGPERPAKGGMDYILDRDKLVARDQITPGNAAASALYKKVLGGEMPPPGQKVRPGSADLALLKQWIDAGAPADGAAAKARKAISAADTLDAILADLQALPPGQRRFVRYFTLGHVANAGLAESVLQSHRLALAKLLNSLSWHPRVTVPRPVDAAKTVLRIDLRDYKQPDRKWDARLWDRLVSLYPYRIPDRSAAAKKIAALTGTELAHLRADWFVATAARPPLYHDLLLLPGSDRSLERLLQVDVSADLQDESAARAGFNGSGVAKNNRLIQRHHAAHGFYWRSYDFSDNSGRQNLFEHPLGPDSGRSSFEHAGGEIIFRLPNGLLGFMLVNEKGLRVDKAPVEIVSDPKRPDRRVETGLSCFSCHAGGLLPKADQVRAHVEKNRHAFTKEDIETIKALYIPEARFKKLIEDDTKSFLRALARTGVKISDPEPIAAVTLRHEAALDLTGAAAELGLSPHDLRQRLGRAPSLARTLGSVIVKGGTLQRQAFEEAFPEVVRAFKLDGNPGAGSPGAAAPFTGHSGCVECIAFGPEGRLALSGGADTRLRLWDVASGKELRSFAGHTKEILGVAFSPDGRRALSAGADRTVRLWDVAGGKELHCLKGHTDPVRCVAFAHDGRRALSGGEDRTIRLWDLDKGEEIRALPGHTRAVSSVAFAPDGRRAVSGSYDHTVRLWDLTEGREVRRFRGPAREVYAVAFAPDGRRVAAGGNDRRVYVWEVAGGKVLHSLRGHANAIICVAFSPDGRKILSGSSQYQTPDKLARLWDGESGKELQRFGDAGAAGVHCLAFSPDGRSLLAGGSHRGLRLWKR
jgi:WD40 repeat protein/mono/diheme cytochrome c family protein